MSDELKEKLREIVFHIMGCCTVPEHIGRYSYATLLQEDVADKTVAEIDQAYKDDTEKMRRAVEQLKSAPVPSRGRILGITIPDEYMTGQEWYERFEEQLNKIIDLNGETDYADALEAAAKASGMK